MNRGQARTARVRCGCIPEPALELLSDTSSEGLALSCCSEAPPFILTGYALLLKPAVRLPFDADAEPTLAPEPALLLEPSLASIGPTTTAAPLLRLAAGAAPVLPAAILDDWMPPSAEPACSAGVLRAADIGAVVSATVSFRAVAGCSLSGNGACIKSHITYCSRIARRGTMQKDHVAVTGQQEYTNASGITVLPVSRFP